MKPILALATLWLTILPVSAAPLRIPAFTAYLDPNPEGAEVSQGSGIMDWHDPALKVQWVGEITKPGKIEASIALRLPKGTNSKLRLTLAGQTREQTATGAGADLVMADFGTFELLAAGYERFTLESLNAPGQSAGKIDALMLDGPATQDAHFNLKERRNAASVQTK